MMKEFVRLLLLITLVQLTASAQPLAYAEESEEDFVIRQIVPFSKFVEITPVIGGNDLRSAVTVDRSELYRLIISFQRQNLKQEDGPQFLKINTIVTTREGNVSDRITQYAFTFAKEAVPDSDDARIKTYAQQILPFGFVSRRKIDSVDVHFDSLSDWSVIKISVTPDEEYTKYSRRFMTERTWYYRVKGRRWESAFYLGIPKVLYDTERSDTITYGNASAMMRFFLLNPATGSRYPLNFGVGTFGVSNPIDVSRNGGGFVLSLFFDVVQLINNEFGTDFGNHFNGGIDLTPFFPIGHRARFLISARIGISP